MDPFYAHNFLVDLYEVTARGKAMKGLQELINRCARTMPGETCIVQNIGKHKTRKVWEMRLTGQIREYDMDQVIFDLGSDANVLLKQTWD